MLDEMFQQITSKNLNSFFGIRKAIYVNVLPYLPSFFNVGFQNYKNIWQILEKRLAGTFHQV